jgi:hypothetical protein
MPYRFLMEKETVTNSGDRLRKSGDYVTPEFERIQLGSWAACPPI